MAKEVARENGKLFAGGICNSGIYDPQDESTFAAVTAMFKVYNFNSTY